MLAFVHFDHHAQILQMYYAWKRFLVVGSDVGVSPTISTFDFLHGRCGAPSPYYQSTPRSLPHSATAHLINCKKSLHLIFNETTISKKEYRKNHEIRVPEVFLIDQHDQKIGIVSLQTAIQRALDAGLDLVEVAPLAQPPVAKIIDFGKLQYEQEKQERKNRAKARKSEVKGIRLTAKIGDHDLMVRVAAGQKFLDKGDRLKIELQLRGREQAHPEIATEVIQRYIQKLGRETTIEQPISRLGKRFSAIVGLKK